MSLMTKNCILRSISVFTKCALANLHAVDTLQTLFHIQYLGNYLLRVVTAQLVGVHQT